MPTAKKPMISILDITTGETIEREMTPEEITQENEAAANIAAWRDSLVQKEAEKIVLLNRLGLTAEEAAILLG